MEKHMKIIFCVCITILIAVIFIAVMDGEKLENNSVQENTDISNLVYPPREIYFLPETTEPPEQKDLSDIADDASLDTELLYIVYHDFTDLAEENANDAEEIFSDHDLHVELEATDSDQERGLDIPEINEEELEMLACAIYQEAGADYFCDDTRYKVGDVILNRVISNKFPDSIKDVLLQKGQYGEFYWTGIVWPKRADYSTEQGAVQRAYDTARDLLTDARHSDLYNQGYIWQAEFKQGTDWIYQNGLYFGR